MDLTETIIPKSDQLNADDLIGGPLDITITALEKGSREQPVVIHYNGDNGRPYKPCKSMRRVLVACWTAEGSRYVGKSLRLYRDDSVQFGGSPVGGIRISHASHIDNPIPILLTTARSKRTPYVVQVLPTRPQPKDERASTARQMEGVTDPDRLAYLRERGDECARDGTEALREFWRGLQKSERAALSSLIDKWKSEAAVQDERDIGQPESRDLFA